MSRDIRALRNDLLNCKCVHKKSQEPFIFSPNQRKVFLITLKPTFQAIHRSLFSVRFFRTMCLALFGPQPKIPSLIDYFLEDGLIYWTHYQKCYSYSEDNPYEVNIDCGLKYLTREIEIVSPSFIVILGAPTVKLLFSKDLQPGQILSGNLFDLAPKYRQKLSKSILETQYYCLDFPQDGTEEEFVDLRRHLKDYINEVDINPIILDIKPNRTNNRGIIAVHAKFEFAALEMYWKYINNLANTMPEISNIEEKWYLTEVIPTWIRYSFITFCCSFIEDQIKVLLDEIGLLKDIHEYTTTQKLIEICEREKIINNDIAVEIKLLLEIRNCIIHNGGRIERNKNYETIINGIYQITGSNTLIITNVACEEALNRVRILVEALIKYESEKFCKT